MASSGCRFVSARPEADFVTVIVTKPPSNIIRCKNVHLQYLCEHAREDEKHQYMVLTNSETYDPDRAAYLFMGKQGPKFTALDDENLPAAAGGYEMIFDGVWASWMVGTKEGWDKHWRSITKGCRWIMDGLFDGGARRLQTMALANRKQAIQWYIDGLKMNPCGVWKAYGKKGEDVAFFERLHPNLREIM